MCKSFSPFVLAFQLSFLHLFINQSVAFERFFSAYASAVRQMCFRSLLLELMPWMIRKKSVLKCWRWN